MSVNSVDPKLSVDSVKVVATHPNTEGSRTEQTFNRSLTEAEKNQGLQVERTIDPESANQEETEPKEKLTNGQEFLNSTVRTLAHAGNFIAGVATSIVEYVLGAVAAALSGTYILVSTISDKSVDTLEETSKVMNEVMDKTAEIYPMNDFRKKIDAGACDVYKLKTE